MANKWKKYGITAAVYLALAVLFLLIGGDHLKKISSVMSLTTGKGAIPEFSEGQYLEQRFEPGMDVIEQISVMMATYARTTNEGTIALQITDAETQKVLAEQSVQVEELEDNAYYSWVLEQPVQSADGQKLVLRAESFCEQGKAPGFYYGEKTSGEDMVLNGQEFVGQLCLSVDGFNYSMFGAHYWLWAGLGCALILGYMAWSDIQRSRGKLTKGMLVFVVWEKYKFLIQQLVARDFKTKYKRSVLGYLWSFLNPLLTMLVQYVVFSTIFKAGIENYPVYLLSGIILFNFFSEAVGQGLMSIVYNSALITKVYVPKYIYPVTKVASTSINLFISVIPLLLVTLLTGVKITPAILLLPFVLLCLLAFCIGVVLALSASTVFFRDTQYLWGIASMVWMYATPLFYPESIIPDKFRFIQTLNPMYHMIRFTRIILIEGVSPAPMQYATCILSALIACVIGAFIFKKTQSKFILYI